MAIFVGDTSTVAIEAIIEQRVSVPFGNVRIWLEGGYLAWRAYQHICLCRGETDKLG